MNTIKPKKDNGTRTVGARITKSMYDQIHIFLVNNSHLSVSDYLRDLIRKDIESKKGVKSLD
jgi:hypothetical protein